MKLQPQKGALYALDLRWYQPTRHLLVALAARAGRATRWSTVLVLAVLLGCPPFALSAGERFSAQGKGWELYSYRDPVLSCRDFLRSRQERAEGQGELAQQTRAVFGAIVTEPNYLYIAFSAVLSEGKVLYLPAGQGNLVLETLDGPVPDQGLFTQLHNNHTTITTQSTLEGKGLFLNPARVMLNKQDEPIVIARFPIATKLDRILDLSVSERVVLIDAN